VILKANYFLGWYYNQWNSENQLSIHVNIYAAPEMF
jgi:hypothetical protein